MCWQKKTTPSTNWICGYIICCGKLLDKMAVTVMKSVHHSQWQELAGTSIWQFKGESVWVLPPMTSADATTELQKWLLLAQWLDNHVMVMMPKHAFIYLDKLDKHNGQINKEQNNKEQNNKEQSYTPTVKDFSDWLKSDSKQNWVADECSKSPVWQYVLVGYDDDAKFNALSQALQKLAKPMYGKLYETMMPLDTAT